MVEEASRAARPLPMLPEIAARMVELISQGHGSDDGTVLVKDALASGAHGGLKSAGPPSVHGSRRRRARPGRDRVGAWPHGRERAKPELLMRLLTCVVVAGGVVGCAPLVGADFDDLRPKSLTDGAPGATEPTRPEAGTGDDGGAAAVPAPTIPDATGACPSGSKKCMDLCVSPSDPKFGCGDACREACGEPKDGVAACRDGRCSVACKVGFSECFPGACEKLSTYYEDKDGDGWGGATAVQGCALAEGLSEKSGDCHDGDRDVHPGQSHYFGVPYTTPSGTPSFDYDCSGVEEPDASLVQFQSFPTCSAALTCGPGDTGNYCWEPVIAARPGGFTKCGARAWVCLSPSGWNLSQTNPKLKAYPCR